MRNHAKGVKEHRLHTQTGSLAVPPPSRLTSCMGGVTHPRHRISCFAPNAEHGNVFAGKRRIFEDRRGFAQHWPKQSYRPERQHDNLAQLGGRDGYRGTGTIAGQVRAALPGADRSRHKVAKLIACALSGRVRHSCSRHNRMVTALPPYPASRCRVAWLAAYAVATCREGFCCIYARYAADRSWANSIERGLQGPARRAAKRGDAPK